MMNPIFWKAGLDDVGHIVGWLNNPETCRYLTANLRGCDMTDMLLASGLRRRDQAWYLFSDSKGAEALGLIALDAIEREDAHANLWFLLGMSSRRNEGLTSAAIEAFCDENPESLHSVEAWAVSKNEASIRCMERAGFSVVGLMKEAVHIDSCWYDRVVLQRLMGRVG